MCPRFPSSPFRQTLRQNFPVSLHKYLPEGRFMPLPPLTAQRFCSGAAAVEDFVAFNSPKARHTEFAESDANFLWMRG
jgi:hypothetical protein